MPVYFQQVINIDDSHFREKCFLMCILACREFVRNDLLVIFKLIVGINIGVYHVVSAQSYCNLFCLKKHYIMRNIAVVSL